MCGHGLDAGYDVVVSECKWGRIQEGLHSDVVSFSDVFDVSGNEHRLFAMKSKVHMQKDCLILRTLTMFALFVTRDESGCVSRHTAFHTSGSGSLMNLSML